jgi:hypothetical protein
MSHQNLDFATAPPLEVSSPGRDALQISPNESLITALGHADFKSAWNTVKDEVGTWAHSSSLIADGNTLTVASLWDKGDNNRLLSPRDLGDGATVPPTDSVQHSISRNSHEGALPGEFPLLQLHDKIKDKATANVEKNMSTEEIAQLTKDTAKYAEEMKEYDKRYAMFAGLNPPKPPEAPESVKRYEAAVATETVKLTKRLEGVI